MRRVKYRYGFDYERVDWKMLSDFLESKLPRIEVAIEEFQRNHPEWTAQIYNAGSTTNIQIVCGLRSEVRPQRRLLDGFPILKEGICLATPEEIAPVAQFMGTLVSAEENLKVVFDWERSRESAILWYRIKPIKYEHFYKKPPSNSDA